MTQQHPAAHTADRGVDDMMIRHTFAYCVVLLVLVLCRAPGQDLPILHRQAAGIAFELASFQMKDVDNDGLYGSAVILSVWSRLGEATTLLVEIPHVSSKVRVTTVGSFGPITRAVSGEGFGNASIAAIVGPPNSNLFGVFQAYLPTMNSRHVAAGFGGIVGDPIHMERYATESTILNAGLRYRTASEEGGLALIQTGVSFWFPGGESNDTFEFLLNYRAGAGVNTPYFSIFGGIDGRLITSEGHFYAEGGRTVQVVNFELDFNLEPVRPHIYYRVPLEGELVNMLEGTYGGTLSIQF